MANNIEVTLQDEEIGEFGWFYRLTDDAGLAFEFTENSAHFEVRVGDSGACVELTYDQVKHLQGKIGEWITRMNYSKFATP